MPVASPTVQVPYRIVIQGEAPGRTEDEYGRPFIGDAGTYLRKYLPDDWQKKVYWTNCVRCRPPKNRTPELHEIASCSVYQIADLEKIKPHAILTLGDPALKFYYSDGWVTGLRGIPFPVQLPSGHKFWVMGTFHPSYVMRQDRKDFETGETTNTMTPVFRNDLKYFFNNLEFFSSTPRIYSPPTNIIYPKSKQEVLNLHSQLKDPHGMDVETFMLRPYMRDARLLTAAFSDGDLTFAFPVDWPGYGWGLDAFIECMMRDREWICQAGSMEYNWVWHFTKKYEHRFQDTEALARLVHKRKGAGNLGLLSRVYLGFDIKKRHPHLDKEDLRIHPLEEVLEYNAEDAWATRHVWTELSLRASTNDWANYPRLISATKSTVGMEKQGLEANIDVSEELQKQYYGEMDEIEGKAHKIPEVLQFERSENTIFRLSEPATVGKVLVKHCEIPLPLTPKGKQFSTDETDLLPYISHPLVKIVLDYRDVAKLLSTYVDPILQGTLFGVDGLLHPRYTVYHTATYRLSSEWPNIQNFPKRAHKEARRQIKARPGHIFAFWDYGQLEGRVIAMFSQDKNLIKSFITDEDIHWKWLYRIIDLYPEYMDRLSRMSGEKDEKKILKAGRTIIKTDYVFSSLYGSKPKAISSKTQLPLHITERVQGEFWDEYAEARIWTEGQFRFYQEHGYIYSLQGRIRNEVLPGFEVTNSPCQGSAAELVIDAQNALFFKAMEEDKPWMMPRINIHDDLGFELPDDDLLGDRIEEISEEVVKPRHQYVTVPLVSECRIGYDWASLEAINTFKGPYFEYSNITNA